MASNTLVDEAMDVVTAELPVASARAPAADPRREFTVVSGAHRGATFTVKDDILLVGADEGCDVWLSDAGLASRHVAVTADGRGVAVRPLDGVVIVDAQPLAPAARVVLAPGSEITLGDSGVRLRLGGNPAAEGRRANDGQSGAQGKLEREPRRLPKAQSRLITASLLVVAGVFAVGLSIQQLRPARAAETSTPRVAADAALSDAELVAQVRDVFRTNGYDAEVTPVGRAQVRIENLAASHDRVKRAAAQARADIPSLRALTFASPEAAQPPKEPPLYDDSPADRMSLHVEGEMAYLSARDGRYFTGSMLPNGDTIRRITNRAVQVERDGQIAWFRF